MVKVTHFGTNRFLIYDFLLAVNSNFCSRTHRLATVYSVQTTTDDEDRRTQHSSVSKTVSMVG